MSLIVNKLFKRYGNDWVWRDISFEAQDNEIFGLFGPNGSGKSTLLRILQGSESLNGGTISLNGQEVQKSPKEKPGVVYIPQTTRSLLSVFRTQRAPETSQQIEAAISTVSSLLLLDEPFCGLDPYRRESVYESIRQTAKEKAITVLFATADYSQILDLCDRVAILIDGEIRQVGSPQDVYNRPASTSVAGIVGRNNIFGSRRLTSSKADHPEFITLNGEHRIFAERADIRSLGPINRNVQLSIRPENISISFGASFPEDNLVKAVVTRVLPRGDSTRVELDSNGLKLEALVLRLVGLSVGDECMLGLPPDRIQILAD